MVTDRITLTIHGLDVHKDRVRASVFLAKTRALLLALRAADKELNTEKCFDYLISDLKIGSAQAEIREIPYHKKRRARGSSVTFVKDTARKVYEGSFRDAETSRPLLKHIQALGTGARRTFSHAELTTGENDNEAVRIDEFFELQTQTAIEIASGADIKESLYRGRTLSSYDGLLKEVDLRGTVARAKLILTAGGNELDCVCNEVTVDNLRQSLDRRAYVEGFAHYDGASLLPIRLDIRRIHLAKERPSLTEWKGKFGIPDHAAFEEEDA